MKSLFQKPWLGRPAPDLGRCVPLLLFLCTFSASAETLKFAGILGNSGEQGKTLVRYSGKPASGIGVVYDPAGYLIDRGGENSINRYAIDGRQLAAFPLTKAGATNRDTIAILDGDVLLDINKKLYSLPLNAAGGTAPALLPGTFNQISSNHHEGWLAASSGKEISMINRHGEKRPVTTLDKEPNGIEIGPDGGIHVTIDGKISRVDEHASPEERSPRDAPGDRAQWLDGAWYGSASHGTLRRFNGDLKPDPGVVLGGASGSFIGYVEGNHELGSGRGLAHPGGNLYAVSGEEGAIHLLEWHGIEQRFQIIRRIGALPDCRELAIDGKGRIWNHTGVWNWSDGPDAAYHHSVPSPQNGLAGTVMLPGDIMVGAGVRWGKEVLYYGDLEGPLRIDDKIPPLPKNPTASTLIKTDKRDAMVILDPSGKGVIFQLANDGKFLASAGEIQLQATPPTTGLNSLASSGDGQLIAAADGWIIEFSGYGNQWQESRRWNSWGSSPDAHFGEKIHLALEGKHLWITDSQRHRVLVFDAESHKPLAIFGGTDQSGNDLSHLNQPGAIAANNGRAVFHDSENQRLIKLELAK